MAPCFFKSVMGHQQTAFESTSHNRDFKIRQIYQDEGTGRKLSPVGCLYIKSIYETYKHLCNNYDEMVICQYHICSETLWHIVHHSFCRMIYICVCVCMFVSVCAHTTAGTSTQIAKFMGPKWGPPGSCRPQMGPMLAPWTLLSGSWWHCWWLQRRWWMCLAVLVTLMY